MSSKKVDAADNTAIVNKIKPDVLIPIEVHSDFYYTVVQASLRGIELLDKDPKTALLELDSKMRENKPITYMEHVVFILMSLVSEVEHCAVKDKEKFIESVKVTIDPKTNI